MKLTRQQANSAGFSMIELMTVIGIMILLAGLLLASLPGIQERVNRGKVETLIAKLEGGLSRYQIDNGIYPQNPPSGDRDTAGIDGAGVLYKHLSGDWDLNGTVDRVEADGNPKKANEEVYVPKLSYDENKESKEPQSASIGGVFMVVDSYGNPVRYLAQPPNIDESDRETYNPTYDLWSIVNADPTGEEAQAKHITNWQSR